VPGGVEIRGADGKVTRTPPGAACVEEGPNMTSEVCEQKAGMRELWMPNVSAPEEETCAYHAARNCGIGIPSSVPGSSEQSSAPASASSAPSSGASSSEPLLCCVPPYPKPPIPWPLNFSVQMSMSVSQAMDALSQSLHYSPPDCMICEGSSSSSEQSSSAVFTLVSSARSSVSSEGSSSSVRGTCCFYKAGSHSCAEGIEASQCHSPPYPGGWSEPGFGYLHAIWYEGQPASYCEADGRCPPRMAACCVKEKNSAGDYISAACSRTYEADCLELDDDDTDVKWSVTYRNCTDAPADWCAVPGSSRSSAISSVGSSSSVPEYWCCRYNAPDAKGACVQLNHVPPDYPIQPELACRVYEYSGTGNKEYFWDKTQYFGPPTENPHAACTAAEAQKCGYGSSVPSSEGSISSAGSSSSTQGACCVYFKKEGEIFKGCATWLQDPSTTFNATSCVELVGQTIDGREYLATKWDEEGLSHCDETWESKDCGYVPPTSSAPSSALSSSSSSMPGACCALMAFIPPGVPNYQHLMSNKDARQEWIAANFDKLKNNKPSLLGALCGSLDPHTNQNVTEATCKGIENYSLYILNGTTYVMLKTQWLPQGESVCTEAKDSDCNYIPPPLPPTPSSAPPPSSAPSSESSAPGSASSLSQSSSSSVDYYVCCIPKGIYSGNSFVGGNPFGTARPQCVSGVPPPPETFTIRIDNAVVGGTLATPENCTSYGGKWIHGRKDELCSGLLRSNCAVPEPSSQPSSGPSSISSVGSSSSTPGACCVYYRDETAKENKRFCGAKAPPSTEQSCLNDPLAPSMTSLARKWLPEGEVMCGEPENATCGYVPPASSEASVSSQSSSAQPWCCVYGPETRWCSTNCDELDSLGLGAPYNQLFTTEQQCAEVCTPLTSESSAPSSAGSASSVSSLVSESSLSSQGSSSSSVKRISCCVEIIVNDADVSTWMCKEWTEQQCALAEGKPYDDRDQCVRECKPPSSASSAPSSGSSSSAGACCVYYIHDGAFIRRCPGHFEPSGEYIYKDQCNVTDLQESAGDRGEVLAARWLDTVDQCSEEENATCGYVPPDKKSSSAPASLSSAASVSSEGSLSSGSSMSSESSQSSQSSFSSESSESSVSSLASVASESSLSSISSMSSESSLTSLSSISSEGSLSSISGSSESSQSSQSLFSSESSESSVSSESSLSSSSLSSSSSSKPAYYIIAIAEFLSELRDPDGDGIAAPFDLCPNDGKKVDPGVCGCGIADVDGDGDGVMNCVDQCPGADDRLDADSDGIPNACDEEPEVPVQPPVGPTQIAHEAAPSTSEEQGPPTAEVTEPEEEPSAPTPPSPQEEQPEPTVVKPEEGVQRPQESVEQVTEEPSVPGIQRPAAPAQQLAAAQRRTLLQRVIEVVRRVVGGMLLE